MANNLTYYQMCARCVTMLYIMSGGNEHSKISKDEFFRQCNEQKIFEMDERQFEKFKNEHIDIGAMARQGDVWPKVH